jgi:hypothetical protein
MVNAPPPVLLLFAEVLDERRPAAAARSGSSANWMPRCGLAEMSMSVRCAGAGWSMPAAAGCAALFAQPRRLIDPRFGRLLGQLVLGPAERGDVIADFSGLAGRALTLVNHQPAAPVSTPAPPLPR